MSANESKKRKQQKRQAVTRLLILAAILILVNMLASRFHKSFDLTKENRFTLSNSTKDVLRNMDDVAVVTIYLEGSFPAGFQRLKEATRERLQSFRDYAGSNVVFKFVNPFEDKTEDEKVSMYANLADKGIFPINLKVQGEEQGYSEKFVFPWALVQYKGNEAPVKLLENKMGLAPLENLNYSESLLEYKFASTIHKLNLPTKPEIAYMVGHQESLGPNTYDMLTTLESTYKVDTFDLQSNIFIPKYYKAIIINNPIAPFDDKEKFKIDQYIMNGGHVLWVIDQLHTPADSLQKNQQFIALDYDLQLDDQLFKYGARVNRVLIESRQCLPMPVLVGQPNDPQPQMDLRSWMYFPVFVPDNNHPIVKNLDGIFGLYTNTIDTIANPEVKKTILLSSSKYSRPSAAPARVSLSMLQYPIDEMFREPKQPLPVAVLLEGQFESLFNNRLHPNFLKTLKDSLNREFIAKCDTNTSMIVVADGDMFENDYSTKTGPSEIGYWRYTNARFANKTFFLNCLEYLTDNSGLLEARTKDTKLRLLDSNRIAKEKQMWQFINIGIPILIVLIFASVYVFIRKRKYESPYKSK